MLFVLSKTAYSSSLVFYDAMLPDITQRERMDEVSSYGYAWGYIGSCIPFVACLLLVLSYESMGISMETAMALAFFLVAAWWLGGAVPLLRAYRQKHYVQARHAPVAESFRRLGNVFSELRRKPEILFSSWPSFSISTAFTQSSTWPRPTGRPWGWIPPVCCWRCC